jgi:hypothetical protein
MDYLSTVDCSNAGKSFKGKGKTFKIGESGSYRIDGIQRKIQRYQEANRVLIRGYSEECGMFRGNS